jgi:serine/threonine protein kinase
LLAIGWEDIDPPWPVLIFELAELGDLAYFQDTTQPLSTELKVQLCWDVASGLNALHQCGIVHGDIKCENVLVFRVSDNEVVAKLADFGHASVDYDIDEMVIVTLPGMWTAPECAGLVPKSQLKYIDIYSFGLLVWRLVGFEGKNPFKCLGISLDLLQNLKQEGDVIKIALDSTELIANAEEKRLVRIIVRMTLERDPFGRAKSMEEILLVLSRGGYQVNSNSEIMYSNLDSTAFSQLQQYLQPVSGDPYSEGIQNIPPVWPFELRKTSDIS